MRLCARVPEKNLRTSRLMHTCSVVSFAQERTAMLILIKLINEFLFVVAAKRD